jgi:diamine N-acetyltransferase
MNLQLSFCLVTINDWSVLQDVSRRTFFESFAHANTESDMKDYLSLNLGEDRLKSEILNPNSQFYFAKIDDHIIGYLKVNFTDAQTEINDGISLEIERIYLLKEFQGKGYGQALYEFALTLTRQRGLSYLWLAVWEKNYGAIRFYERNGLVPFGKHSFFLGQDEQTDILMKTTSELKE